MQNISEDVAVSLQVARLSLRLYFVRNLKQAEATSFAHIAHKNNHSGHLHLTGREVRW